MQSDLVGQLQRHHGKKDLDLGKLECPPKIIIDVQIESTNQPHVFLNAHMPLQLTPDQHLSGVGDVKVMATTPEYVEPYHPIQFRLKEHIIDEESMMKSLCNHELIDSHDGENDSELEVKNSKCRRL